MKPFSFYLPSAAALAAVGLLTAAAVHPVYAQKAAPIIGGPVSPIESPTAPTAPAVPISIEEQARGLNVSVKVIEQWQGVVADKETWTPAQQKMDSALIYASRKATIGMQIPNRPDIQLASGVVFDEDGRALTTLKGTVTDDLLGAIVRAGGVVLNAFPEYGSVRTNLPLAQIEALAARSDVTGIITYLPPRTSVGAVNSQGDTAHQAGTARTSYNITGAGQIIGVISDGDRYLANSKASGDINANATVVINGGVSQDGPTNNSGEGTAMMEIVQDLAPGARILFATGNGGQAQFASNIRRMFDFYGATVIVDDLIYLEEGPFQDDVVAQAVNYVIGKGVQYFSSAGNYGSVRAGTSSVWEGDFSAGATITAPGGTPTGVVHKYNTSATGTYNIASIYAGFYGLIYWSDPLNRSTNDYDAFSTDNAGTTLVSVSTSLQNGSQSPFEYVFLPNGGERVFMLAKTGAQPRMLRLDTTGGSGSALSFSTNGQTWGHSAAAGAYSVAATPAGAGAIFNAASDTEYFTSDGPRRIFYNADGSAITPGNFLASTGGGVVRQKPDITAADGVSTTVPGFQPFYGTSAAAPHAGAIAGLIKSTNGMTARTFIRGSALTPAELYTTLTIPSIDIGVSGFDVTAGYGIVNPLLSLNFLRNLAQNVSVSNVRNNTATVSWRTNLPAASTFTYGAGASTGGRVITDPTYTTTHSVALSGLTAGTRYAFSIGATTQSGSVVYNSPADVTFTTTGLGPTTTMDVVGQASAVRSGSDIIVTVQLQNSGSGIANAITLTGATLTNATLKSVLPLNVGSGLYPGGILPAPVRFSYPAGMAPGGTATVTVTGKIANGPSAGYTFTGTAIVRLP